MLKFTSKFLKVRHVLPQWRHLTSTPNLLNKTKPEDFVSLNRFQNIFSIAKQNDMPVNLAVVLLRMSTLQMVQATSSQRVELARQVFDETSDKDVNVYNALLESFIYNGHKSPTVEIMEQMKEDNITLTPSIYASLIGCHCINGDISVAEEIVNVIKSQNLPITDSIPAYMAYGQCLSGHSENAIKMLEYVSKGNILSKKVVYFICKGLAETNEIEKLEEVINYVLPKSYLKLKTKFFIDIACELLKANHVDSALSLVKILDKRDVNMLMILNGISSLDDSDQVLMDLVKKCKSIEMKDFEEKKLITGILSKSIKKKNSFDDLLEDINLLLSCVSNEEFLFDEVLKYACLENVDLCFDILLEMKKRNLVIKPHMLLPVCLIEKDPHKIKEFCLSNDIELDELMFYENTVYKTLDEISDSFSKCDKPSEKIVKELINKALKIKKSDPEKLAKVLMQMNTVENHEAILSDCIIQYINQPYLSNLLIQNKIKPLMISLRGLKFKGINEKEAFTKLHLSKHSISKILTVRDTSKLAEIEVNITGGPMVYNSLFYDNFNKFYQIMETHCGKHEQNKKFCLELVSDAYKFANDSQRTKVFNFILSGEMLPATAYTLLWYFIQNGCVEQVEQIHRNGLINKEEFPSYFIPSKYLDESMRPALTVHLTEIYGEEICNWIIYLSCLSNGKVNEAADFLKQNQMKWPKSKSLNFVSHCSAYIQYIPPVISTLIEQCKDIEGFSPFFFQQPFIGSLLKLDSFDNLELVLEAAKNNNYKVKFPEEAKSLKKIADNRPSLLNSIIENSNYQFLLYGDLKESVEKLKTVAKGQKIRSIIPYYLSRLVEHDELYKEACNILKMSRLNYDADLDYKISNLRILYLLENSRYEESSELFQKTYASPNIKPIAYLQFCSEVRKLSRKLDDINIFKCLLGCSEAIDNVVEREITAFNMLKDEQLCSKMFVINKIITKIIADDEDAISKAYEEAWKDYTDAKDIYKVKNLTLALMLNSTSEQIIENIRKIEEINFSLLPNMYSQVLSKIENADQLQMLLKTANKHPLLSAQSQAVFTHRLLEKYITMMKKLQIDKQSVIFSEIENNFRILPSYLHFKNSLKMLKEVEQKSHFGVDVMPRKIEEIKIVGMNAFDENDLEVLTDLLISNTQK